MTKRRELHRMHPGKSSVVQGSSLHPDIADAVRRKLLK